MSDTAHAQLLIDTPQIEKATPQETPEEDKTALPTIKATAKENLKNQQNRRRRINKL